MGWLDGILGGVIGAEALSLVKGYVDKHGGIDGVVAELESTGTYNNAKHDVFFADFGAAGLDPSDLARFPDYLISIGSQPEFASSLDRALQMATTDMVRWLVNDYKLEPWAAHQLIGAAGKYDVVTVAGSMALKVQKKYLAPK